MTNTDSTGTNTIIVQQTENNVISVQETNTAVVQAVGARGAQGSNILTGNGVPASNIGVKGDYYIDSVSHLVYGPKTSDTVWNYTSTLSLAGSNGLSFLTGTGAPAPSLGNNGDTYLNTVNGDLYTKSSPSDGSAGTWSKSTNIIQPAEVSFTFEQQFASPGGRTPIDGGTGDGGWYINHNLRYKPSVFVSDYGRNNVECDIEHVSNNLLILTFSQAVSGYAYLA
jgi:hypothetical protein